MSLSPFTYYPIMNHGRVSHTPLDHLFVAVDDPVANNGVFNAGVQLFMERATSRVVIRKKSVVGGQNLAFPRARPSDWFREMEILASLDHKNIVEFVAGYVTEVRACLYMEVCDLGSLEDLMTGYIRLRLGHFPRMFIWHVTRSLLDAMIYCHFGIDTSPYRTYDGQQGLEVLPRWDPVLHRDMHFGNVFLQSSRSGGYPIVKVGDFGCGLGVSEGVQLFWGAAGTQPATGGFEVDGGIEAAAGNDCFGIGQIMRMMCYMTTFYGLLPNLHDEVLGDEWPYAFRNMVRVLDGHHSAMQGLLLWQEYDKGEDWPPPRPLDQRAFKRIMW